MTRECPIILKILSYITNVLNVQPSDIKTIIITHAHIDHIGSLGALKQITGAKIAIHSADADFLSDKKKVPYPKGAVGILFRPLSFFMRIKPIQPDILLNDTIFGLTVIHTPGHTPGSISLYDPKNKVMFTGDLLRYTNGRLQGPPSRFTPDPSEAARSIEKIKRYDFDIMLSGHGAPLRPNASEKVKAFSTKEM